MERKRVPLQAFAEQHQGLHTAQCWICTIPERKEIDAALRGGVGQMAVYRWLTMECGYQPRVRNAAGDWTGHVSTARINSHSRHAVARERK